MAYELLSTEENGEQWSAQEMRRRSSHWVLLLLLLIYAWYHALLTP